MHTGDNRRLFITMMAEGGPLALSIDKGHNRSEVRR